MSVEPIYRIPIMAGNGALAEVMVEPNPFGDPHTVKVTFPWAVGPDGEYLPKGHSSWAILPRDMFSERVNQRTAL